MTRPSKYRGLCLACTNDPACKLPRASSILVEQCAEYASRESGAGKAAKISANTDREKIANSAVETARVMGLCVNCETREACTFMDARKAVKYCEEYR